MAMELKVLCNAEIELSEYFYLREWKAPRITKMCTHRRLKTQWDHSVAKTTGGGGWLDSLGSGILVGKIYFGALKKYLFGQ